jgi:hypothetical protein
MFEHALNAILLASDDGRYLEANPAACRLLGYSHDQLVGRAVAEVVVPGPHRHGIGLGPVPGAWPVPAAGCACAGATAAVVDAQYNAVAQRAARACTCRCCPT